MPQPPHAGVHCTGIAPCCRLPRAKPLRRRLGDVLHVGGCVGVECDLPRATEVAQPLQQAASAPPATARNDPDRVRSSGCRCCCPLLLPLLLSKILTCLTVCSVGAPLSVMRIVMGELARRILGRCVMIMIYMRVPTAPERRQRVHCGLCAPLHD